MVGRNDKIMTNDPRRQVAQFIESRHHPWQLSEERKNAPLDHYDYCGIRLSDMTVEFASNLVQTKLAGW